MGRKSFPARMPRYAAGIRLQDARGTVARSWWAKRFQESLEPMNFLARLGRARAYALGGQVLSISSPLGPHVEATVMGVRAEPYRVAMDWRAPSGEARGRIIARLRAEPMFAARLLANDMPTEIEAIFRSEGFHLFPGGTLAPGRYDVTTSCTCPDYANPCKHSLAVLLLLGEEMARRPALLLALRGIPLEELCDED